MRKRIIKRTEGSTSENTNNRQLLQTLTPITTGRKTTILFVTQSNVSANSHEQHYNDVTAQIRNLIERKPYREITIPESLDWFELYYRKQYGYDCIDFNRWNAQKVFKTLQEQYSYALIELVYHIALWICLFDKLDKVTDKSLTISTLKRRWITDSLLQLENIWR